ncbi:MULTISPECIES: hypothetical protein [unclassified Serratia (in: enterobacteria)]|uniref:hypothetical protein n=1 Tax=unclassified Serratia (in: enterobacteria) TaxID=2647522 RepID=UPI0005062B7F|nr:MULTISPECIES: hypothetical protein [unclassified Serratia (in: enterobacteria)]KFK92339.1 hypothetical protein JV45_21735 [Serratia sp. Ag2]KFK98818.1 hypothetical protein IV04_11655 [Serratia sp. Ag1]
MEIIGHSIEEFRTRAFYIDKSLVFPCILLFIKIDKGGWFSLTIDEGKCIVSLEESEPKSISLHEITDSFAYPIQKVDMLNKYAGRKLKNVMEYRLTKKDDLCIGIYLQFDSGGLSIIENDGGLSFFDGVCDEILNESQLMSSYDSLW